MVKKKDKVQSFRVTGLFAGQYNTEDYGTFTVTHLEEQQVDPPSYWVGTLAFVRLLIYTSHTAVTSLLSIYMG